MLFQKARSLQRVVLKLRYPYFGESLFRHAMFAAAGYSAEATAVTLRRDELLFFPSEASPGRVALASVNKIISVFGVSV